MAEGDRLAVEHGFGELAVFLVHLAISPRGELLAFGGVGGLDLGRAVAGGAGDLLAVAAGLGVGLGALDVAADARPPVLRRAVRLLGHPDPGGLLAVLATALALGQVPRFEVED